MRAKLSYKVIGVASAEDEAVAKEFRDEIALRLEHLDKISSSGSGNTVTVNINVNNIEPFNEKSFEAFVFDQVWDSVHAYYQMAEDVVKIELTSCEFSA